MTRFRSIALVLSIPILIAFAAFVVNQTNQVVLFTSNISPILGQVVLWLLLACYAVIVVVPIVLFVRLPTPLEPPNVASGPEFDRHLRHLKARLVLNRHLDGRVLETQEDVEAALVELGQRADAVTKESASIVFLTTAISQNGRLDGLVVLLAQTRMVWRIARIYYQRPSLRDLINLYANVASTAFVAAQLEDIDVEEQIEPIVESMAGAAVGAVPGMTAAATILSSSILTGSTNAFLTLRVGIIARQYCGSLVIPEKRILRRIAAAEAARLLLPLVWEGGRRISSSTFRAMRNRFGWRKRGKKDQPGAKARQKANQRMEEELSDIEAAQLLLDAHSGDDVLLDLQQERESRKAWWKLGGLFG